MNERDIFLAAIAIADPTERARYVDRACSDNTELRDQVEELLKTHEATSQFLETPAVATDSAVNRTVPYDGPDADEDLASGRASGKAEFCRYLEPTTRPGWLGRLAHYEIEDILGQGAFGIVAKAFDEKLHRVVAIKMLSPALASTSPPRKRFLREARVAASVSHPNIVAVFAVEEEPIPFIVMEFVAGETLQQRMNRTGPLEVIDVVRIGRQIAEGLAAAHAVNLIHRDIKPANILLSAEPNEQIKISDFGLARAVDDASMTVSGFIAGTPMYMAPEQARGETLDHRADLFSLGSLMYQMASGRPPFRAANAMAVLKRVCEHSPRPLKDVIPTTPDWLCAVIRRLMAKQRDSRFQTATEAAVLLAHCANELETTGLVTSIHIDQKSIPFRRDKRSTTRHNKVMGWSIAATVLIGVPLAIWMIHGWRSGPSAATVRATTVPGREVPETATSRSAMIRESDHPTNSTPDRITTTASSRSIAASGSGEKAESSRSATKPSLALTAPLPPSSPQTVTVSDANLLQAPESPAQGMSGDSETHDQTAVADAEDGTTRETTDSEVTAYDTAGDDEFAWVELFGGRTLQGWQSTDMNPRAWRVEDGAIVVSGPGRGYLHRDFVAKNFEVSLEYRTLEPLGFGPFTRAPDHQLGKHKAVEITLIDFASLASTRLEQDGGINLPPASPDHLTLLTRPVGKWNHVRLRMQGFVGELWLNGRLFAKKDDSLAARIIPHHTAYTREAVRVVLQHWGPERVEFRNIRVRELPPPNPAARPDTPRVPSRVKRGGGGIGGGRGFGGGGGTPN